MARSVSHANNSVHIAYSHLDADDCDDWGWYSEDFQSQLVEAFPSLERVSKWVGREDKAVAENSFAYFGVSEYCGLVSMWVASKDADWRQSASWEALRDGWIASIGPRFHRIANSCFGQALVQTGRFSNGECMFTAVGTQNKGELGLGYSSKEGRL